jgi:hypothetical protein
VKVLVRWRPGLDDVGVDVTEDGRPQDRLRACLIAPGDEQHPPGGRVEFPDPRQELCPRRFRQPLVSQHQTDLAPVVAELAEDAERLLDGPGSDDLVVSPIALAQLSLDAVMRSRVVDQQQNRFQNRAPDLGRSRPF